MEREVAALALIALAGAMIQTGLGFGFGLFFVPFAALVVPPREAVAVSLLLGTVLAAGSYYEYRPRVSPLAVAPLVLGALVGTPLGIAILIGADQVHLHVLVASAVFVSAIVNLRNGAVRNGPPRPDPFLRQAMVGFAGGMIRGAVSMGGPPIVLYQHWIGGGAQRIRGRLFAYFFWLGVPATVMAALSGVFEGVLLATLLAFPSVAAGIVLGRLARPYINELWFGRGSMLLLAATAAVAIVGVLRTAYR